MLSFAHALATPLPIKSTTNTTTYSYNLEMALPKLPTEQFPSSNFLICSGSILFASTRAPLQVCLLHHTERDEWLLPKGRKDRGECVPATAIRETFEETGYPCRQLPLNMVTRAPAATAQTKDAPEGVNVNVCEEPFMLTLRRTTTRKRTGTTGSSAEDAIANGNGNGGGGGGVKLIWWFAAVCTGADKVDGTQTAVESFESAFFGVDEALRRATFQTDRDVIARAVELVRATYPEAREEPEPSLAPKQNPSEARLGAVSLPQL
jgi:8-oxo-dGTP pyrophosphatase MutT (NUDIX family)